MKLPAARADHLDRAAARHARVSNARALEH